MKDALEFIGGLSIAIVLSLLLLGTIIALVSINLSPNSWDCTELKKGECVKYEYKKGK